MHMHMHLCNPNRGNQIREDRTMRKFGQNMLHHHQSSSKTKGLGVPEFSPPCDRSSQIRSQRSRSMMHIVTVCMQRARRLEQTHASRNVLERFFLSNGCFSGGHWRDHGWQSSTSASTARRSHTALTTISIGDDWGGAKFPQLTHTHRESVWEQKMKNVQKGKRKAVHLQRIGALKQSHERETLQSR